MGGLTLKFIVLVRIRDLELQDTLRLNHGLGLSESYCGPRIALKWTGIYLNIRGGFSYGQRSRYYLVRYLQYTICVKVRSDHFPWTPDKDIEGLINRMYKTKMIRQFEWIILFLSRPYFMYYEFQMTMPLSPRSRQTYLKHLTEVCFLMFFNKEQEQQTPTTWKKKLCKLCRSKQTKDMQKHYKDKWQEQLHLFLTRKFLKRAHKLTAVITRNMQNSFQSRRHNILVLCSNLN